MYRASKVAAAIMLTMGITACGDSSSNKDDIDIIEPENSAPTITLANGSVLEKESITLSATVTDDGTISTYEWSQTAGTSVGFTGGDTNEIVFVAPNVNADEELEFSLTATDDKGASTSQMVMVLVEQKVLTLTINGIVTDEPIINANVMVNVGETEYTFVADSSGNYSAELNVDDDATAQFVSIIAQGVEEQEIAKLNTLLGSVSALISAAGDDNVLTKDELFDVNVTNLTTAKAALMLRENLGESILTDEKLAELSSAISAEKMISLAVAIKVAIDQSAGNSSLALPVEITDTLELANNEAQSQNYIAQIENTVEYTLAAAEMLADENVVDGSLLQMSSRYYFIGYEEYIKLDTNSSQGNTGYLYKYNAVIPFNWEQSDNQFTLDFSANPYVWYSDVEQLNVNGVSQQVQVDYVINSKRLQLLFSSTNNLTFDQHTSFVKHFPNDEFADEPQDDDVRLIQATSNNATFDFALPETLPAQFMLPVPAEFFSMQDLGYTAGIFAAEQFSFNANGSGHAKALNMDFNWEYVADQVSIGNREIVVTLSNNTTLQFTQLTNAEQAQYFAVLAKNETKEGGNIGIGGQINSSDKFETASVPGIYLYNDSDDETLNKFWWELWPSGKAYTISTNDIDESGDLTSDEVSVEYGDWSVNDEGILSISRWKNSDNPQSSGCFGHVDRFGLSCYLYNDRKWQLYGVDGNVNSITNYHYFDFDADGELETSYIENRKIAKVVVRPVEVPDNYYLPSAPPTTLPNLIDPSQYVGVNFFTVDTDYISNTESLIQRFSLSDSSNYIVTELGSVETMPDTGTYQVFTDNSLILTESDYGHIANYAFVLESNDVVISSFIGLPWINFRTQDAAETFVANTQSKTSVASFANLVGQQMVLADKNEDDEWDLGYVVLGENNMITIYSDETFTVQVTSFSYTINEDGSLNVGDDVMFISLSTDKLSIAVVYDADINNYDYNYFFTDVAQAKDFVFTLKQMRHIVN